jgi:hypothetical protein
MEWTETRVRLVKLVYKALKARVVLRDHRDLVVYPGLLEKMALRA